jgi:hypothetical protein
MFVLSIPKNEYFLENIYKSRIIIKFFITSQVLTIFQSKPAQSKFYKYTVVLYKRVIFQPKGDNS